MTDRLRCDIVLAPLAINPVVEPDGRDRIVDWYHRHKVDETDERTTSPGVPYWGKYVFHDNNRDINYSQITMKNVLDWYLQWHPPIMHDLHESVPFLYTFSGQSPQNPTLDPILYAELPWFTNYEKSQMMKFGMPGVWDFAFVDMWSPGYLAFMSSNHNGIIRMYETFGNGGATTMKRTVAPPDGGAGQTSREWYRPWPPYKEVVWSMRNNTNYMQTGVLTALELTSKFPKVILENFYKKSFNSIESGKKDAPFGYVIPGGQKDQTRVAMLVNLLRVQGIEVGKATAEVSVKEGRFPAGSFVVKRDQPYGRLAKILLEKQNFPEGNLRTYDDTGWTMGLMSQTEVKEIADLAILQAAVEPVTMVKLQGSQSGSGRYVAALNFGANNMASLRFKFPKVRTLANEKATKLGDTAVPAGSLWFDTQGNDAAAIKAAVESLGLTALAILKDRILMKYPGQDRSVMSGLFRGANEIRDRPAIVNLPQGKGQIVLFAGNPCYRWQNFGEFGMLVNTILHWNDLLANKAPLPAEKPASQP